MSHFPIGGKGSLELAVRVSEITLFESSSSTFFQSGTSAYIGDTSLGFSITSC